MCTRVSVATSPEVCGTPWDMTYDTDAAEGDDPAGTLGAHAHDCALNAESRLCGASQPL